jgi:lipoprotein-anchoring transpeptidase ErfK/SrfK
MLCTGVAGVLSLGPTTAFAQEPLPAPPSDPAAGSFDVRAPSRAHGATVARIVRPTLARRRLGSSRGARKLGAQTVWSGQPNTLLVLDGRTRDGLDWVKLLLPYRPNGSTGWVRRDHVVLGTTRYWIDVRTRSRTVTVLRDGKRLRRFRAVVGAPDTPTPVGLAAIYERNPQPDPRAFLGPWALSLTALSEVLENYGGGPGRVAIHGRSGASLRDPLGTARSHGCIRIDNRRVRWMARRVPPGTPVKIVRRPKR